MPCSKPNGPLSSATREVGMASPVLGSVRRTIRRPSTTPRAEVSLTLAIASFRLSVGRCPPHSCFEGRSATPASRRVLSSVALCSPRRASRPGLVRWAGRRIPACPVGWLPAVVFGSQHAAAVRCSHGLQRRRRSDSPVRRAAARALPWSLGGCLSLRPCLGVGRAGFTGCPGLSRAVCRGLGLAGGARSVSGRSSSLQNLRDRHSLAGPDCLGVFERAWQSLRFSSTATRPLSRSARGQGLQFRPRTRRHRSTRTRRHRSTGRVFPGRRGGLARLSHPGLASADRLLADLLSAGGFRDSGLAGRRAQHDPGHAIRGPNLGGQTDVRPRPTRSKDHAG